MPRFHTKRPFKDGAYIWRHIQLHHHPHPPPPPHPTQPPPLAHLLADARELVLRHLVDALVDVVDHLLAGHEVPDAVAGQDHPVVGGRV